MSRSSLTVDRRGPLPLIAAHGTMNAGYALTLSCILWGLLSVWPTASAQNRAQSVPLSYEDRVALVGSIWGDVRYFHPAITGRAQTSWDEATLEVLHGLSRTTTSDQFVSLVDRWLETLADPTTRVASAEAAHAIASQQPVDLRSAGDARVITFRSYAQLLGPAGVSALRTLSQSVDQPCRLIFDLRVREPAPAQTGRRLSLIFDQSGISARLGATPFLGPLDKSVIYWGYPSEAPNASPTYSRGEYAPDPARTSKTGSECRVAFLTHVDGFLPAMAAQLLRQGQAMVMSEGPYVDAGLVQVRSIPLEGGAFADLRMGAQGDWLASRRIVVDVPIGRGSRDRALELAQQWLAGKDIAADDKTSSSATSQPTQRGRLAGAREQHLLALLKLHYVFKGFYPYRDAMPRDWDGYLRTFIPLVDAPDADKDPLAVMQEFLSGVQDSHVNVWKEGRASAVAPIEARDIEGRIIVTTADPVATGLQQGDEIVAVNSLQIDRALEEQASHVSASTPQARRLKALAMLLSGPKGEVLRLRLRGATGEERDIDIRLGDASGPRNAAENAGKPAAARMLDGIVGYIDLRRLQMDEVDGAFATVAQAQSIIFDMRGYPQGTGFRVASILGGGNAAPAARFERRIVRSPGLDLTDQDGLIYGFTQRVPAGAAEADRRPTYLLIDERAISQAEHLGLLFRAAAGTRFVGSPTNGANGDVTIIRLPGGFFVSMTGQAVSWPDGQPLQGVGLKPDFPKTPTIAGIRAGKDEVLDYAIELARSSDRKASSHGNSR